MNTITIQRERALAEARKVVEQDHQLIEAWQAAYEALTTNMPMHGACPVVLAELQQLIKDRGRDVVRQLAAHEDNVQRVMNTLAAASRPVRA